MFRKHSELDDNTSLKFKDDLVFLLCIAFLQIGAAFYYGLRVILLSLISVIASVITHRICEKVSHREVSFYDLEPIVLGATFACLLPPSASIWIAVFGAVFMQAIVILPFGGAKNCHINAVAAAFCFSAISWSETIFLYPTPFTTLPLFSAIPSEGLATSPAGMLMLGGRPIYSIFEMFLGAVPGAIGTSSIILILASLTVFLQRRKNHLYMTLCTLVFFFVFSLIFNRTTINPFVTALYEIMSGSIAFGAVFMVPRCAMFLKDKMAKVLFSSSVGVLAVLFRFFGGFEESFCFALLLSSVLIPFFNAHSSDVSAFLRKVLKYIVFILSKKKRRTAK